MIGRGACRHDGAYHVEGAHEGAQLSEFEHLRV
jgi:hypothetical protein